MIRKRLLLFVYGIVISQICSGQDSLTLLTPQEDVLTKMATYHLNYPQEKIYLHFDKPHYVLGERIWFKAYLVHAILHNTITPSQQIVVELIDPRNRILVSEIIPIEKGGGIGDFLLEPTLTPGDYLIRAYTNYQRNFKNNFFFEKEIRVYNAYSNIAREASDDKKTETEILDLRSSNLSQESNFYENNLYFFPEGGELVSGLPVKVAVNAFDKNFNGVKVSGEIHDKIGQIVTRFGTEERGLGFFSFVPLENQKYFAVVHWEDQEAVHPLPEIADSGYGVSVKSKSDTLFVDLRCTDDLSLKNAFLVTHIRGQLQTMVDGLNGKSIQLRIPLANAPAGVFHLTLFSGEGIPLVERLVYNHRDEQIIGTIDSKSEIENRKKFKLSLKAEAETPINGSISITSHPFASPSEYSSTISTYLLLESDLRGRINDPVFYLSEEGRRTGQLDLLMITHGWKRFEWRQLLDEPNVELELPPDNTISLRGHTTKYGYLWKPQKSRIFVSTLDSRFEMFEQITGEDGYFELNGLDAYDSIPLLIQAERFNTKKELKASSKSEEVEGPSGNRFVNIYLDIPDPPFIDRAFAHFDPEPEKSVLEKYFENSKKTFIVDSMYKSMPVYQLDEVVIESRKVQEDAASVLYKQPDKRLIVDSTVIGNTARNVFEIIEGRFPGVNVVGSFPHYEITMMAVGSAHDNSQAIYVLDGKVVDADVLNVLPVFRIDFIDILSSLSKSAVYGSSGNGVIAVYTKQKRKASKYFAIGSMNHTLPGYYLAKKFTSPDYGGKDRSSSYPDFRTTLYWAPEIIVAPGKTKEIQFYTGDLSGDFQIRFEGISLEGDPVVLKGSFKVK